MGAAAVILGSGALLAPASHASEHTCGLAKTLTEDGLPSRALALLDAVQNNSPLCEDERSQALRQIATAVARAREAEAAVKADPWRALVEAKGAYMLDRENGPIGWLWRGSRLRRRGARGDGGGRRRRALQDGRHGDSAEG